MGIMALIDAVLHPHVLANGLRMKMQMLSNLSLGPALCPKLMHLLIHLQLPTTLFPHGRRFAPWRLAGTSRRRWWRQH